MQIAFHIGAHCTDDDRLIKSMLKDVDPLRQRGVKIPGTGRYRNELRQLLIDLRKSPTATEEQRAQAHHIITDGEQVDRVVLTNPTFACFLPHIFDQQLFYNALEEKLHAMRILFPEAELSYFMGMRAMPAFLQTAFSRQDTMSYDEFMRNTDPAHYRWGHVVERMRRADPSAEVTVWCHEDSPYIWGQLVRAVTGVDRQTRISGGYDMMQVLVEDEGMAQFVAEIQANPPRTEREKRDIIGKYMRSHSRQSAAGDLDIKLPGWDQDQVDRLNALYYEDLNRIDAMQGVTLITP